MIIDSEPGFEVVAEAADGREALGLARTTRADVILMDIRMPHMDGLEATRRIGADNELSGVRVLVLTTFENDDNVFLALRAGASGFLGKNVALDELTEREREVLALVAHGLSNDDITGRLNMSPLTAKTHVNRAMTKLGVRDRAQLVVIAYQCGLVRAGDALPEG
jgi:DNA-binding NarL/FixJ family response regulator